MSRRIPPEIFYLFRGRGRADEYLHPREHVIHLIKIIMERIDTSQELQEGIQGHTM